MTFYNGVFCDGSFCGRGHSVTGTFCDGTFCDGSFSDGSLCRCTVTAIQRPNMLQVDDGHLRVGPASPRLQGLLPNGDVGFRHSPGTDSSSGPGGGRRVFQKNYKISFNL